MIFLESLKKKINVTNDNELMRDSKQICQRLALLHDITESLQHNTKQMEENQYQYLTLTLLTLNESNQIW